MQKQRRPLVAGNWKMYGSLQHTKLLVQNLAVELSNLAGNNIGINSIDVAICPPAIYIPIAHNIISNFTNTEVNSSIKADSSIRADSSIKLGAQNIATQLEGALTGEISCSMLQDFACSYVIVGHSERRSLFQETNQQVAIKCKLAYDNGLTPILCIGETQEQRDSGATLEVLQQQLAAVIELTGVSAFDRIVVAYEPVWAIGTGVAATPEQAQSVHAKIREFIAGYDTAGTGTAGTAVPSINMDAINKAASTDIANNLRIIYGGSLKPGNAAAIFNCPDIDGGLIGKAALQAEDFSEICQQAQQAIAASSGS